MYVSLITLGVTDVERSTRFYEAMSWERSSDSVEGVVSFLRGGATVLGLFGRDALSEDAGGTEMGQPPGPVALATNVSSSDVVDMVLDSAGRAGGTVVKRGQATDWGGYSGYFADPDGHLWEVAHNPAWDLLEDGRVILTDDPEHEGGLYDPQRELREYRARVDARGGTSSEELADDAVALLEPAMAEIAGVFEGTSSDQIIAAMTLLTQRGMDCEPASREAMLHHAASSLVSSLLSGRRGTAASDGTE